MIRIGTSGWTYPEWRGEFYPSGLPQRRQLAYLATCFGTTEVNGSFYSLQRPTSYQNWAAQTPEDFRFAVKGGRYITHVKRLRDLAGPLANFFASGVLALADKLGPILWQLPPTMSFDPEILGAFLAALPRTTKQAAALGQRHDAVLPDQRTWLQVDRDQPLRHAVEARHESFRAPEFAALLSEFGIASVLADTAGKWPRFDYRTADFSYVRLHGDTKLYVSSYADAALVEWAALVTDLAGGGDVYVYFDNTATTAAPRNALRLAGLLAVPPPATSHRVADADRTGNSGQS